MTFISYSSVSDYDEYFYERQFTHRWHIILFWSFWRWPFLFK